MEEPEEPQVSNPESHNTLHLIDMELPNHNLHESLDMLLEIIWRSLEIGNNEF